MRPQGLAGLIAGLLTGLGHAEDPPTTTPTQTPPPDLGIWKLDVSCAPYYTDIERAYGDVSKMVAKTVKDLEIVLEKRPGKKPIKNQKTWDRIGRAMGPMFGFVPDPNKVETFQDNYWKDLWYVYDRMNRAFQGDQTLKVGYGSRQPTILCSDDRWEWKDIDAEDPLLPGTGKKLKDRPESTSQGVQWAGAYYWDGRLWWRSGPRNIPSACTPDTMGYTKTNLDMIQLCDEILKDGKAMKGSAVLASGSLIGQKLDQWSHTLPNILFHEFSHWFGADGRGLATNRHILDQNAVDKDGRWLYRDASGTYSSHKHLLSKAERDNQGLTRVTTYKFNNILNLATNFNSKKAAQRAGPDKCLFNADSYNVFGTMMYLDDYDWSTGKAESIEKHNKPPAVPTSTATKIP
ncbi:uncharacterized protein NECHADRAFT_88018 [Fusarium vanettenii 77-13-4]|uniref:Lysine-specific metallo-endopeptidase domain-containing protein n=1 Tax=Fusarium vanettenii (strain ATCC MYA-4622 / CBS 123669 / FGSC 9596 / NRRL 45880 / 77-13-4) TaxID=660122 RepID=C7ZN90_FUSV7|nr:uncharacterized protein NECHADRAFT_88018 [Fusarium vanettenii 77-13-4]EEU34516.1 hypothetical protein NECHADRAFT_88018 [Fusarium vanettenii 77-13-4]